jgi:DNA-binding phage protein
MSLSPQNTSFPSVCAADFLSPEELEEAEFLRSLKGTVREWVAALGNRAPSQARLAEMAGMDPAQLSRALNPDAHVSTRTLFRVAYALGCRWQFGLTALDAPYSQNTSHTLTEHTCNLSLPGKAVRPPVAAAGGGSAEAAKMRVPVRAAHTASPAHLSLTPA